VSPDEALRLAQAEVREAFPDDPRVAILQGYEGSYLLPLLQHLSTLAVGSLLDLGPGHGTLLRAARHLGWGRLGLDRFPLQSDGVPITRCDVLDPRARRDLRHLYGLGFDVLCATEFLEHLAHDAREAFLDFTLGARVQWLCLSTATEAFPGPWPLAGKRYTDLPAWTSGADVADLHHKPWTADELRAFAREVGFEPEVEATVNGHRLLYIGRRCIA